MGLEACGLGRVEKNGIKSSLRHMAIDGHQFNRVCVTFFAHVKKYHNEREKDWLFKVSHSS